MRILHHGLGLWPAAYKRVARSFVHRPAAPLGLVIPDTLKCAVVRRAARRAYAFCSKCGSPIYSTSVGEGVQPSYMVRVGILRQRDQLSPRRQQWWRSARPWVSTLDAVPKTEKQA